MVKRNSILLNKISILRQIDFINSKNIFLNHSTIDFLIFMPTKMAFEKEIDVTNFLFELKEKLDNYNSLSSNIFYKSHQGNVENYFTSKSTLINFLIYLTKIIPLNILFKITSFFKSDLIIKFFNILIFNKLKSNYKIKSLLYPLLPIEMFLNLVNIKLIGSFSNTLITSSYLNKTFELIGQKDIKTKFSKRNLIFDSSNYLKLNMSFFLNDKNIYQFDSRAFQNKNNIIIPIYNLKN
jgi:hypothetical protein